MGMTITRDLKAPPEKIFYWLDDSQRVMQWCPHIVEQEDLTTTEDKVGSTFRQVYDEKGRKMEFFGTVIAYEENRRLAITTEGDSFGLDVEYILEPIESGTRITQNTSVAFKGFWKLIGPPMMFFMKKSGVKQVEEDLGRLEALARGGA